ncbi:DUF86 domain-containing protein [Myxacorys almedinensis]|uniref:DUF86 domain-containing protein n=1 Tax=Myxacorys almedinensis A TaxID=2690445 RepID=A0A8J7Z4Q5_9CYAN|nr:DUF86 domain-containing protein [Myxacorys almedinensis]NDJ19749.1 DUF86 domain-containing protein [Myxacorys almedinensis A]
MNKDDQYLYDILDSARLAISYVANQTKEAFLSDIQTQDSVNRRLMIMGKAANRISEETRQAMNTLPWRQMIGMRNLLVHEYDDVNLSVIWDTVKTDLPQLVVALEALPFQ